MRPQTHALTSVLQPHKHERQKKDFCPNESPGTSQNLNSSTFDFEA